LSVREGVLDANLVMFLDGIEKLIGFGVETTSIKGKDAVRAASKMGILDQSDIFSARKGNADITAESGEGVIHDFQWGLEIEFLGERIPVELLADSSSIYLSNK
jgi:hypothetical protein